MADIDYHQLIDDQIDALFRQQEEASEIELRSLFSSFKLLTKRMFRCIHTGVTDHYKYYIANLFRNPTTDEYKVVIVYGRIGKTQTKREYKFFNQIAAHKKFDEVCKNRLHKKSGQIPYTEVESMGEMGE